METEKPTEQNTGSQTDGIVIREKPKKQKKSRGELQDDLITRLNHLRAEAREICESYIGNLDGDVSTLVDFLNGSSEVRKPDDTKAATMKSWTKTMDRLTLKPAKGRKKDLKRIDDAIRSMMRSAFD